MLYRDGMLASECSGGRKGLEGDLVFDGLRFKAVWNETH